MPPEGGGGGDIPLGAEKRMWHHDRALLISSWYGVPPVRRSPRCAWGWGVAWDAGLPHKTLLQPPNAGTAEPFRVSPPEAVAYPLELQALGVAVVIYPRLLTACAIQGMKHGMAALRAAMQSPTVLERPELAVSFEELNALVGFAELQEREQRYATP